MENIAGVSGRKDELAGEYSIKRETRRYVFAFLSIFFLLYVAYGNSFYGVWVFDDYHDILPNKIISSFTWPDFIRACITDNFARPLVTLSFAFNYHLGGYDIYGYHIVNFAIHFISSIFVFLFVYKTLLLPSLAAKYRDYAYSIALLAAAFWCTSPLHVNAVTYIVQRYTSMSGMFYFMAMFFFVQGRTSEKQSSAIMLYTFCAMAAIMAFLSKENAAMIPVSIYLYDFLLIRGVSKENVLKDLKRAIWPIAGLLLLGIILLSTTGFPMDYKVYTFTLKERILTEPRIVIFYLSLLLYPLPQRLMFDHDYVLSTSLFTPWTTGVAICFIIGLIAWAFFMARKRPLISFCILFFFINHVIESSIIPIEIIYEYRNYVPSISFFMLAALFMVRVLKFFQSEKVIFFMAAGCITFLLIAQADTVYRRNNLFFSENILWMDNIKKAPNLSRPHTNLGFLYQKEDNFKDALSEAKKAIEADKYPNYLSKATMYTNLGGSLLVMDNNNQEEALKNFLQAIILQPKFSNARFGAADVMIKKGDLASATEHILVAISLEPDQSFYHSKYSLILFHQGKYKESLKEAFRAWNLNYYNAEAKMIIAEIMKKRKLYKRAILFWNHYLIYVLNDRRAHLALIELYALTNQPDLAKAELNFLLVLEKGDLRSLLAQKNTYDHVYDINGNVLKPIIKKIIAEISQSAR